MEFDRVLCCGCGACVNVCPVRAITWTVNAEGFSEPQIDNDICIDCNKCRKVCPYETNHVGVNADPQVFAAVHSDAEVVRNSSSGGVFTAISDVILARKGVVYGVAFDAGLQPVYVRASTRNERDSVRGSKYVQCDGKDVYSRVVEDLNSGREVLFTGTPCQVSGLKLYLSVIHVPTDHLYLVDNVCHGAASPLVWREYLAYIQEEVLTGKRIERLSMRSKKVAWQKQYLDCETESGDESDILNAGASWNKLYLTTYATRPSCFNCRFTSYERVGDLTCADYWNIENAGVSLDYSGGVNLVLVSSKKGRALLDDCAGTLQLEESNKKACWQIHLEKPVVYTGKRAVFWAKLARDKRMTVKEYAKGSRFNAFTRTITPILRKLGLYTMAVRMLSFAKGVIGSHANQD